MRVLIFGSTGMGFSTRGMVNEKIDTFLAKQRISLPIIITTDDPGIAEFAVQHSIASNYPYIILPAGKHMAARDIIMVDATDVAIIFWDGEEARVKKIVTNIREAQKPAEIWELGPRGMRFKVM